MAKASRQTAALRREAVVAAASRRLREGGPQGLSIPALMAEAGLTHGGFYKHFVSKAALEVEACERALAETPDLILDLLATHGEDGDATRLALFDRYLSAEHRDDPGQGCAIAALAADAGRDGALRLPVTGGIERMIGILEALYGEQGRPAALHAICLMAGALVLARATRGEAVSDEILLAAKESLA